MIGGSSPDNLRADLVLEQVWKQARHNHDKYSATGSRENDIRFLALGLTGEAGELANFVKKRWRDGDGHDEAIKLEIADVLAYAFMLAQTMGLSPAQLIQIVADKQLAFVAKMEARNADRIERPAQAEGAEIGCCWADAPLPALAVDFEQCKWCGAIRSKRARDATILHEESSRTPSRPQGGYAGGEAFRTKLAVPTRWRVRLYRRWHTYAVRQLYCSSHPYTNPHPTDRGDGEGGV